MTPERTYQRRSSRLQCSLPLASPTESLSCTSCTRGLDNQYRSARTDPGAQRPGRERTPGVVARTADCAHWATVAAASASVTGNSKVRTHRARTRQRRRGHQRPAPTGTRSASDTRTGWQTCLQPACRSSDVRLDGCHAPCTRTYHQSGSASRRSPAVHLAPIGQGRHTPPPVFNRPAAIVPR